METSFIQECKMDKGNVGLCLPFFKPFVFCRAAMRFLQLLFVLQERMLGKI